MLKKIENAWLTYPNGFLAAGVKAGIKTNGKEDVALVFSNIPAVAGAVFTQNVFVSPAVVVSRRALENESARAVVVNAGCANACTGEGGLEDAAAMAALSAELLEVKKEEVFVCSTGVIGQRLDMAKVRGGIRAAWGELSCGGGETAARAIQTTDTFLKSSAYEFTLGEKTVRIAGIAKGSGMIAPNMATMLAFITTDAAISKAALQRAVSDAAARSFNMVIVDGDTSTNDSFITLANGNAGNERIAGPEHPLYPAFYEALLAVAQDLAKLIARDGEGATKFLTVAVKGAADFADAGRIARAIAKSPLVKTAFFGEDPNWGRIICAAGYAGAVFDPEGLTVALNGERIFAGGRGLSVQKEKIRSVMRERDIIIEINLDAGEAEATLWTCDFSYDYVKINAEYHT